MTNKTHRIIRKSTRMKRKSKRTKKGGAFSYPENVDQHDNKRFKSEEKLKNEDLSRKIDDSLVIEDIMSPEKLGMPAEELSPANYYKRDDLFYQYLSLPKNKGVKFEELSDKDRAIEYMHYLEFNPLVTHPIGIPNGRLYEIIIAYRYEYQPRESLNFLIDYADTNFLLKMINDQPATYLPNGISKMWKFIGSKGDAGRKLFNKLLFLQYKNGILLSKGLCYFPPATKDFTVYRGMSGTTPVPKTNEPVIYLMSTSPKKIVANYFALKNGKNGKILNITIPKNFPFSYISGYEPEAEILLGYKSAFVVGPKIMKDGIENYHLTLTGMKNPSKELEDLEEANMLKKIEEFEDFKTLFKKRVNDYHNTNNDDSENEYNMNIFTIKRHFESLDDKDVELIDAFFEIQNEKDRADAESLFASFYRKVKGLFRKNKN